MLAKVNPYRNVGVLQRVGKPEVGGGVINRIASQNDQKVNFASAHLANELFEGLVAASRVSKDRVTVEDSFADISELLVDPMSQSVNYRRLVVADNDSARAVGFWEVLGKRYQRFP